MATKTKTTKTTKAKDPAAPTAAMRKRANAVPTVAPTKDTDTALAALHDRWYYTTGADLATLTKVYRAWVDGGRKSPRQAGADHGVSYQPAWAWVYYVDAHTVQDQGAAVDLAGADPATVGSVAACMRADGLSWGHVMSRCNVTEGHARRAWESALGLDSRGMRTGHGGRPLGGDRDAYDAVHADGTDAVKVGLRLTKD